MKENKKRTRLKPIIKATRWNPEREKELIMQWEKEGLHHFDEDSKKPIFSIDTPPPYASGPWHVAGAAHYAQIDMIARYFKMKGFEVLFSFGIDRNGLPVEVEVEKKYDIHSRNIPREDFIETCSNFLDEVEKELIEVARRMGMSCDFSKYYRTDSPEYRMITQASFIELWRRGLVHEDNRPTSWCPACGTTIAEAEIEYREIESELIYSEFEAKEDKQRIVIATTRPELLCSCLAILFNPKDERYQHLEGKTAIVPIFKHEVPILSHNLAKPEFGSGLVMICSYGDYTDIRTIRELGLDEIVAIDTHGRMTEVAGIYQGFTVKEARSHIKKDLEERNLLVKRERIIHREPICWRSKDPVEFISMREYYLKQIIFLDDIRRIIKEIRFHPPELKQILLDWINSLSTDWPISRRRFYGTEIPLWYCKECNNPHIPEPGKYYQPWKEKAPFDKCECGSTDFIGEERTFDTWMDSSISQLYILGYLRNEGLFQKSFPCSLRPQGVDITRTWLYYSILRTLQLFDKSAFVNVRLSGMGLDENGEAMHKSKGNVVYPRPIFQKYGLDAFRFWGAGEAKLGSNYRFSEERVKGASLFITKLWNISRFVSSFPKTNRKFDLETIDKLILEELKGLIKECDFGYEQMDVYVPANAIRTFTWSLFADHYIEAVKSRAYNQRKEFKTEKQYGAWYTLHTCLETILKLLAPICPFVTDSIWQEMYSDDSIHLKHFPREEVEESDEDLLDKKTYFMTFNNSIWRLKKEKNIALSQELDAKIYAPLKLEVFKDDLKAMHKIKDLLFGEPIGEDAKNIQELDKGIFLIY